MIPYLWVKAVHVSAVLVFVGGLFLQVFALGAARWGEGKAVGQVAMWDRRVTMPAMLLAWLTGATLATEAGWFTSPWLWCKLALVLALTGLHGIQSGKLRRRMRAGVDPATLRIFPMATWVTILTVLIVVLVVVKPF